MVFDSDRANFLRPLPLLYELLILHEIQKSGFVLPPRGSVRGLNDTMVQGYLSNLIDASWVKPIQEGGNRVHRLTPTGEQRLRTLLVDYVQELIALYGNAQEIFHKRLAEFYFAGVRRVAFYPIGETAEVVYRAIQDSGIQLVTAVDDDPTRWDAPFHEVTICSPQTLTTAQIDAVIVTTCAFQTEVIARIQSLRVRDLQILSL